MESRLQPAEPSTTTSREKFSSMIAVRQPSRLKPGLHAQNQVGLDHLQGPDSIDPCAQWFCKSLGSRCT
jgi:hypothetical protein